MKAPKKPKPTAQQIATERRQAMALDEEIAQQEERFRAMSRGQLGVKSMLGGLSKSRAGQTAQAGRVAPAGQRSMLGGMPTRPGGYGSVNVTGMQRAAGRRV